CALRQANARACLRSPAGRAGNTRKSRRSAGRSTCVQGRGPVRRLSRACFAPPSGGHYIGGRPCLEPEPENMSIPATARSVRGNGSAPTEAELHRLKEQALRIRRHIVTMLHTAQSGHPGGSLSAVELVTALYFGGHLRYDPNDPDRLDLDRFILSKGHGVPVQYAAMAEAGFFPVS